MQKFNLHTHTFRCGHASGTDDQMVLSAIEAGFELLGFSDHMPYPELHLPTCRMFYDQRQEYVDSMAKLKVKYQDRIQLRFGYEAEYLEDHQELLEQLHGEVDYLILGQHFKAIETNPAYELVYDYDAYNNDEDVLFYAGQIEKAVATGWFSLIAHPDYFMLGRRTFTPACAEAAQRICAVSAKTGKNINELKRRIAASIPAVRAEKRIVSDLLKKGDTVILVTPIDESAPKGRLILPQQQTIRDILDIGGICMVAQPDKLASSLDLLKEPPRMIVCDSQVFGYVDSVVPKGIALTSFSILFARYRGDFEQLIRGSDAIDRLKDGDTVLISEGCTHHRQCGDIGTVKLPAWLKKYTGKELNFRFTSGGEFPKDISGIALVVHCGGCMLNARELSGRLDNCEIEGVSVTNYGIAIAKMHGILERALSVFHICQV